MITEKELRKLLKAGIEAAGSVSQWCRIHKIEGQRGNVSQMRHGKRDISGKVADKLGYEWNKDLKPWTLKGKKKPSKATQVKYD